MVGVAMPHADKISAAFFCNVMKEPADADARLRRQRE
jgi:hypothetical protein